ncbi:hypothetical protein M409DRAFT_27288 [Zasmidium cellare ATCC 36951]|uniref:Uncharacterized protein n=1 Tax=Zasmidium cellare ATCC 36951 TaxID=1080233 RepID=A0A6A6C5J9_ZASCE|nr:uncharacterized protein M409DRAFT_27288 [Zasmidium cellare ATCC 36951]KAF2162285.1 hypothetical protein M409DRAFT_27288 [Zasmidium cellare ATCC 36951]
MESFSRILPISKSRFSPELRDALLATSPLVFEENLDASYISREPNQYTHNPTRAGVAVTPNARLVVMAMGAKKIDIPLGDARWREAVDVTSDKNDRVIFKVHLGVAGTGTKGSSLEIRVRTTQARRIVEIAQQARVQSRAESVQAQDPFAPGGQSLNVTVNVQSTMNTPTQPMQRGLSRKPVPGSPNVTSATPGV